MPLLFCCIIFLQEDDYLMHNYFLAQKAQATKNHEVDLRGVDDKDKFVFYAKDRHANKEVRFLIMVCDNQGLN